MSRKDLDRIATETLAPYGLQKAFTIEETGVGFKLHWEHGGKSNTLKAPRDLNAFRSIDNFKRDLRRQMRDAGIDELDLDNSKIHINDQIKEIRRQLRTLEERLDVKSAEIDSCTELALEAASGVEGLKTGLLSILGQAPARIEQREIAPTEVPYPKVAIAPAPSLPSPPPAPEKPKGFDALEQVMAQRRAEALADIEDPEQFDIDDFEGHILHFIHKCGPQAPHDLRVFGVWKSSDSATNLMQDMEARGLLRLLLAEKKYAITRKGIEELAGEPEDEAAPVALSSVDELINGQQRAAPVLQIVPKQPRVLAPIPTRTMPVGLSVKDEMIVYLHWNGPKTTAEMRADGIRGYGPNEDDVGTAASMAKGSGYLTQERKYGPWGLTPIGRAQAMRILGETPQRQVVQK